MPLVRTPGPAKYHLKIVWPWWLNGVGNSQKPTRGDGIKYTHPEDLSLEVFMHVADRQRLISDVEGFCEEVREHESLCYV